MTKPIIIIGAGAAGIGAGLRLKSLGVQFLILEAKDRVGGRAYTDNTSLSYHWDQGCGWFHCADVNPLVRWADRLGSTYETMDRSENALFWSRDHWLDAEQGSSVHRHINGRFEAIYAAARQGMDIAISNIPRGHGWDAAIAEEMVKLMCSDEPKFASASGYADYDDTGINWTVTSGYGDLINRMAAGLPIRKNTIVSDITYHKDGVRVRTNSGDIDARAIIVTVPTNVLRSRQINMPPGPVQDLLDLMEGVPCGSYEKAAIELEYYPFDPLDCESIWVQPNSETNPVYFQISEHSKPILIAHIAGQQARDLVSDGPNDMADFAIQNLSTAFGSSFHKLIRGVASTSWQTDPFIKGGYSYARPGAGQDRPKMIALDTGTIAFAGEAFSLPWYGTAHGAYQSGTDKAAQLVQCLGL